MQTFPTPILMSYKSLPIGWVYYLVQWDRRCNPMLLHLRWFVLAFQSSTFPCIPDKVDYYGYNNGNDDDNGCCNDSWASVGGLVLGLA